MSLARLIPLLLQISIALIVVGIALRAKPGDITSLLRRPSLLVRSLLAMNVVMPIVAAAIAHLFHLRPQLEVALILLAVSPVPPVLPTKQAKAGGDVSYAVGLLALAAGAAIVLAPPSVTLIGRLFGRDLHVPMATIAVVVAKSVLVPLIAGVVVRRLAPSVAERLASPVSTIATGVLVVGLIPILVKMWGAIVSQVGDFTLVAIVLFTLIGLAVGHVLGGPDPDDRTVLAFATASRHPGVAIAIASAITADKQALVSVAATILLCVLVGVIITAVYAKWRTRAHTPVGMGAGTPAR